MAIVKSKRKIIIIKINLMNTHIISEETINKIVCSSNEIYFEGIINMNVEQALIVMLKITRLFKFNMDYQIQWYSKHQFRIENELERFKVEQGITDWKHEMDWIQENGALQYHISIQDLLLQTLYAFNGLNYRSNDRDYNWEEKFNEIFVGRPYGKEFDIVILRFLLLPLYNATHDTNYVMSEAFPKPS
jgi:hypothetical protein